MLVVVLGAGASFDSNPALPPRGRDPDRPPLADQLFDTDRPVMAEAALALPRAAAALMAARADVARGGTVEATLARLQAGAEDDPVPRSQLMAVRFYLQRVLAQVAGEWDQRAVRQTSYVSLLDQLRRWQRATNQGLCLVTFNYDVLLESACSAICGVGYGHLDDYQAVEGLHLYKPHGSVNWARAAPWRGNGYGDADTVRRAVCNSPDLEPTGDYTVRDPESDSRQLKAGSWDVWLPALAIPVERKPDVVMPAAHLRPSRRT